MNLGTEMKLRSQDAPLPLREEPLPAAGQSFDASATFIDRESSASWALEQLAFNELLSWLAPDREAAGQQYVIIRQRLTALFRCRACVFPDELADETINRVIRKLPQIKPRYVGSPARYFFGVAKKVYLEYCRPVSVQKLPPAPSAQEDLEVWLQRLDNALSHLEPANRDMVLSYYQNDGQSQMSHRKELADRLGINLNTLRLRVHRIKAQLRNDLKVQS